MASAISSELWKAMLQIAKCGNMVDRLQINCREFASCKTKSVEEFSTGVGTSGTLGARAPPPPPKFFKRTKSAVFVKKSAVFVLKSALLVMKRALFVMKSAFLYKLMLL